MLIRGKDKDFPGGEWEHRCREDGTGHNNKVPLEYNLDYVEVYRRKTDYMYEWGSAVWVAES